MDQNEVVLLSLASLLKNLIDSLPGPVDRSTQPEIDNVRHVQLFTAIKESLPSEIDLAQLETIISAKGASRTKLTATLNQAGSLSTGISGQAGAKSEAGNNRHSLNPIQNSIQIRQEDDNAKNFSYAPSIYSPESILPCESILNSSAGEVDRLWNEFLDSVGHIRNLSTQKYINMLLSLIDKYFWHFPVADLGANSDISLIDRVRTASAISVCLYTSENDSAPFILASGEFGGIQKYIFDIKSGSGGMAKALRGRSFGVSVMAEMAAFGILQELGLPLTHLVLSAGGRFYLLLPNTKPVARLLTEYEEKLHNWILDKRDGRLRFNLVSKDFSSDQIIQFSSCLGEINDLLFEAGLKGLRNLHGSGSWDRDSWLRPKSIDAGQAICKSCGAAPAESNDKDQLCKNCNTDRDLGRLLAKTDGMVIEFNPNQEYKLPFGSFDLLKTTQAADPKADMIVEWTGEPAKSRDLPFVTVLKNNHVPRNADGDVLEFREIADLADGKKYLAMLKADIDNLGYIISSGLSGNRSISRISTLSRALEFFSSGYMRHLLKSEFPETYTVFSGGDDMLFIGPWNRIFELGRVLQAGFAQFACQNPSWGLSAGIAVFGKNTPVLHAYEAAKSNLNQSKIAGKNSITTISTTMTWKEYDKALKQGDQLADWIASGVINSAKAHRFLTYAEELKSFHETKNTSLLGVVPRMIYDLTRNWGDRTPEEREAKAWAHAFTNPEHEDSRLLPFICQYGIYKTI